MDSVRWILGVVCFAFGALCSVINAGAIVLWLRQRIPEGRSVSGFPLVGACFFWAGLALLPIEGKRAWWWLPFVLDPSCSALVVLGVQGLVQARRRTPL